MTNTDGAPVLDSVLAPFRRSMLLRILGLGGLILSLRIPIGMIDETIAERSQRRVEAIADVTKTWGGRQIVRGPFLTVPYVRRYVEQPKKRDEKPIVREEVEERHLMPETLGVDGDLRTEVRRRGIFDVPLYVARLELRGTFRLPAPSELPANMSAIRWDQTSLALGTSDPRAIRENVVLTWGATSVPLRPGPGDLDDLVDQGLHAIVPVGTDPGGKTISFAMSVTIAGSDGISVLPAGADTTVRLRSPWPDPSFDGAFLPVARRVTPQGFEATWRVLELARGIPGAWVDRAVGLGQLDATLFGVGLLSPVDAYRTTERAVKYQLLFVGLTFTAFFLFELLAGLRVHPVQYLLVGLALCLFYLLLLSLAEHVGFVPAYALASTAIAGLVSAYGRAVLGTRRRTAAIAGLVASLYLYLFVLLHIQDYALLVGSVGLFAILATIMFVTRRVDWYAIRAGAAGQAELRETAS
jgi:inner membrane protein